MTVTLRSRLLKNGSQSLYLDIYHQGQRRYMYLQLYLVPETSKGAKLLNDNALRKAHELRSKIVLGIEPIPAKAVKPQAVTLHEWLLTYALRLDVERNVSATTRQQTRLVTEIVLAYLSSIGREDIPLSDFGRREMAGLLHFLCNSKGLRGRKLSQSTLSTYQQRLVAIFSSAVQEGLISTNPLSLIDKGDRISQPVLHKEYLTMDEVARVAAVNDGNSQVRLAFLFACFTGLRLSDLRQLRWSDLKPANGCLTVVLQQQKTKRMVIVPLCKTAISLLPEKIAGDEHVFHLPQKTWLRTSLLQIMRSAGIAKHVTFHSSRHTFATLSLSACRDIKVVSSMLGHKSVRTTEIYADVMLENKQKAMSMLSHIMDN